LHPARHASDDEEKRLELRKTKSRKVVDDLYEWRLEQRPLSASPTDLLREFRATDNVSGRGRFPEVR
jgi:hypothetical protein